MGGSSETTGSSGDYGHYGDQGATGSGGAPNYGGYGDYGDQGNYSDQGAETSGAPQFPGGPQFPGAPQSSEGASFCPEFYDLSDVWSTGCGCVLNTNGCRICQDEESCETCYEGYTLVHEGSLAFCELPEGITQLPTDCGEVCPPGYHNLSPGGRNWCMNDELGDDCVICGGMSSEFGIMGPIPDDL